MERIFELLKMMEDGDATAMSKPDKVSIANTAIAKNAVKLYKQGIISKDSCPVRLKKWINKIGEGEATFYLWNVWNAKE